MARRMPELGLGTGETELNLCSANKWRQNPCSRSADAEGGAQQEEECLVYIAICCYCAGKGLYVIFYNIICLYSIGTLPMFYGTMAGSGLRKSQKNCITKHKLCLI